MQGHVRINFPNPNCVETLQYCFLIDFDFLNPQQVLPSGSPTAGFCFHFTIGCTLPSFQK